MSWQMGATYLALKAVARFRRRYSLMVLILAAGLAVYLLAASLAAAGTEQLAARSPLALPAPVVARLPHAIEPVIGFVQTELGEAPLYGEPVSVLSPTATGSLWHPGPGDAVRRAEPALGLDSFSPLGRTTVLFLVPGGEAVTFLTVTAGRLPRTASEVVLPEEKARLAGIGVGDSFPVVLRYPWNVNTRHELQVVGLLRSSSLLTDVPVSAFTGGEITFGPLKGASLLTGTPAGPEWNKLAATQSQPNAAPVYANLVFAFPAPGRSVPEVERWLEDQIPVLGYWSAETPAFASARIAGEILAPVTGVMFLVFGLTGLGLFAVLLLGFLERRREIAVYKALGVDGKALGLMLWLEMGVVWLSGLLGGFGLAEVLSRITRESAVGASLVRAAGAALGLHLDLWTGGPVDFKPATLAAGALASAAVVCLATVFPLTLALVANVSELARGGRLFLFRHRVTSRRTFGGVPAR